MARNKPKGKKLRLAKALKSCIPAPIWFIIRKYGRKRGPLRGRWSLNIHKRRNWRSKRLKA